MVRINLINPVLLSDQHLIAEHNEIQMLITYIVKYPKRLPFDPVKFTLGKGHMKFFRNKISYLFFRLSALQKECCSRGFNTKIRLSNLSLPKTYHNIDYNPSKEDLKLVSKRIKAKLMIKPEWYRYYSVNRNEKFWNNLMKYT